MNNFYGSGNRNLIIDKLREDGQFANFEYRKPNEKPHHYELDVIINNIVCCFSVGSRLDLKDIGLRGTNVIYKKESGVVTMQIRKPAITASVYASGKVTCFGATSELDARRGGRRVARIIQRLGFKAKFCNYKIVNVVGSSKVPFGIKLNDFTGKYISLVEYNPEIRQAVLFKMTDCRATVTIYSTGQLSVTADSVVNVQRAIEHVFSLIYEFRFETSSSYV